MKANTVRNILAVATVSLVMGATSMAVRAEELDTAEVVATVETTEGEAAEEAVDAPEESTKDTSYQMNYREEYDEGTEDAMTTIISMKRLGLEDGARQAADMMVANYGQDAVHGMINYVSDCKLDNYDGTYSSHEYTNQEMSFAQEVLMQALVDGNKSNGSQNSETPVEAEETETPVDDQEETETPSDDEGESEAPVDDQEETETPSDDEGETEAPVDDQEETETPSDDEGESEAPVDDQEETETPSDDEGESEAPVDDQEETETPSDDEGETEAPVDEQEETETPSDDEGETEAPVADDDKTETPSTDDGKSDAPSTDESKSDAPTTDDGKSDAPTTDDDKSDTRESEKPSDGDKDIIDEILDKGNDILDKIDKAKEIYDKVTGLLNPGEELTEKAKELMPEAVKGLVDAAKDLGDVLTGDASASEKAGAQKLLDMINGLLSRMPAADAGKTVPSVDDDRTVPYAEDGQTETPAADDQTEEEEESVDMREAVIDKLLAEGWKDIHGGEYIKFYPNSTSRTIYVGNDGCATVRETVEKKFYSERDAKNWVSEQNFYDVSISPCREIEAHTEPLLDFFGWVTIGTRKVIDRDETVYYVIGYRNITIDEIQ